MVKSNLNVNEILRRAKEEGEIFLVSLSSRELEKTGFGPIWEQDPEKEFFNSFSYVDIYLIYTGQYALKYMFDGDVSDVYYEYEEDLGKYFLQVLEEYLRISIN